MARCACGNAQCDQVRGCLSAGPGINYDATTGIISAPGATCAQVRTCLQAGTGIEYDSTNGIITATGQITTAACGFTGNGTAATPLALNTDAWPFACPVSTGTGVYCDPATGSLHSDPEVRLDFFGEAQTETFPSPGLLVPAATTPTDVFSYDLVVTNPDPCRSAHFLYWMQGDVYLDLPPASTAEVGVRGDAMGFHFNNGATTQFDVHTQFNRVQAALLAPSEVRIFTINFQAQRGTGNARIQRIQTDVHSWIVSNP